MSEKFSLSAAEKPTLPDERPRSSILKRLSYAAATASALLAAGENVSAQQPARKNKPMPYSTEWLKKHEAMCDSHIQISNLHLPLKCIT